MSKLLNFSQNIIGVFALVGIIAVSTIVTLGLSPVAVSEDIVAGIQVDGNLAGITTSEYPQIISNFIPLEVIDLSEPTPRYTSQLLQSSAKEFEYNVRIAAQDRGDFSKQGLRVVNPNSAPVVINFFVSVPEEVARSINIAVIGDETYRVNDSKKPGIRVVQFQLEASESIDLNLEYEYVNNVLFPIDVSYRLSY